MSEQTNNALSSEIKQYNSGKQSNKYKQEFVWSKYEERNEKIIRDRFAENKQQEKNKKATKQKTREKQTKTVFNSFDANEYADEYDDYNHFHGACEGGYDIYDDSFKTFDFGKRVFDEDASIKNIDFISSKSISSNKSISSSNSIIDANSSLINSFAFFDSSRNISQKRVRDYDVYEIDDEQLSSTKYRIIIRKTAFGGFAKNKINFQKNLLFRTIRAVIKTVDEEEQFSRDASSIFFLSVSIFEFTSVNRLKKQKLDSELSSVEAVYV